jgi:type I restriction enzyme, S subunit
MSFSEWTRYKLEDVLDLKSGKSRPKEAGEYPVYGGNGILDYANRFNTSDETIIIGRVGAYCGSVYFENRNIWISDNALYAKSKTGFNSRFLYYYLKLKNLNTIAGGSSHPLLTQGQLNNIDVELPREETQNSIALILSSLDDKIELNRQTNQTLEAIAKTLFKEMCLTKGDDLPAGWRNIKLGEVIKIKHGYAFKGEFFSDEETEDILVTPGNFKIGGGFNYSKFKYYNGDFPKDYVFNKNDLVVTMTDLSKEGDTLGYSALIPTITGKRLLHNQRIGKVEFKENSSLKLFLYFIMRENRYRNFVLGGATGTTVRHTSPDRICDFNLKLPDTNSLSIFSDTIKPILEIILCNEQEIQTLSVLRDSLLPKLMRGEILL